MKKTVVLFLILIGLTFPAAAEEETIVTDSTRIEQSIVFEDGLKDLGVRLAGLETKLGAVESSLHELRNRQSTPLIDHRVMGMLTGIIIVALCLGVLVFALHRVAKNRYVRLEKEYEVQKMWIERGGQLPIPPKRDAKNRFVFWILLLVIFLFVWFIFMGVNSLWYSKFFAGLIILGVAGGFLYLSIRLFRIHLQGRDETNEK